MKPDEQQDLLLRKYLQKVFSYQETYQEVYDHLLSALDNKPQGNRFQDEVNQIICNDFGGHQNLRKIEDVAKKATDKEVTNKYLHYLGAYFKFPQVFFTLVFTLVVYAVARQIRFTPVTLEMIFLPFFIGPAVLVPKRLFKIGYLFGYTKKSTRDDIFNKIAYHFPGRLFVYFNLGLIVLRHNGQSIWPYINDCPSAVALFFVLSVIYMLSLIKLYRDEFKMNVIV